MKEILAIIPARGGSKGIPRKNVTPLAGQPLISYTIQVAKASKFITRLVVSTDDEEIARTAAGCGAEVVKRPAEISGDLASSEAALLHVLDHLEQTEQYSPELLVFLQCTSPLTTAADIDGTIHTLLENGADTALTVTPFHYYLWRHNSRGEVEGINHDKYHRPMRQEREPQFLETGAVYVMEAEAFKKNKYRFFGKTVMHVTPEERCCEIDEPVDLIIAEQLILHQKQ